VSVFAQYLAVIMLDEAEKLDDEVYSGTFKGLSERLTVRLSGVRITENDVSEALIVLNDFAGAKHFEDFLTGGYWQVNYDNFRYYFIEDSPTWNETDKEGYEETKIEVRAKYPVLVTFAENGRQFAEDIIQHLTSVPETEWAHLRSTALGPTVPAADRIVTLSHNQLTDIETSATELVNLVELENSIDGDAVVKDLVVGQLKAGRELIRAQSFRAYLLYTTLLTSLGLLIEKYSGAAIGVAAAKLLELLIEQVFKA
jgi:hypothetical protein